MIGLFELSIFSYPMTIFHFETTCIFPRQHNLMLGPCIWFLLETASTLLIRRPLNKLVIYLTWKILGQSWEEIKLLYCWCISKVLPCDCNHVSCHCFTVANKHNVARTSSQDDQNEYRISISRTLEDLVAVAFDFHAGTTRDQPTRVVYFSFLESTFVCAITRTAIS